MSETNSKQLKVALLGYGKMGKTIAALAPQRGLQVELILDEISNGNYQGITPENFKNIDVGTTGWHHRLDEVRKVVEQAGIGLVYGANFSIGVQLFYRAAQAMAEILKGFSSYEPYITESHHRFKKD